MKKYKYIYDIKSKRFIKKLNEDESQEQTTETGENTQNSSTNTGQTGKSVETNPDMQKLNK